MNKYWQTFCFTICLFTHGLLLICVTPTAAIAWQAPPASAREPGKQGKDDNKPGPGRFEEELFQGLDKLPASPKSTSRQQKPPKAERGPAIDVQRQRRLTQGEDLGQRPGDSWSRIGHSMRNVEGRIAAGDLGKETQQLQKMIVQDLAGLMKQFRQQSSDSSFRPGTGAASSASSQAADNQQNPATDSTPRIGSDTGTQVEPEDVQMVMEELWGHLPARLQAQLRGAAVDQFLPKYERLLEQFYRRLAEQEGEDK